MNTVTERARAYIAQMPTAIQGSGGSTVTFNVAVALCRGFALSEPEALALLTEWNQAYAAPPWSESDLRHKIRDALKSPVPLGYLLKEGHAPSLATSWADGEAKKKAYHRSQWPTFRPLSEATMRTIADLRGVSLMAVAALHSSGVLRGAMVDSHRCFILTEGTFAQARRLDGGCLLNPRGEPMKTKNLFGSQGRFMGRHWLGGPSCPVLLVEGCIGLLEATAAALAVDADCRGWTIVSATSAMSRFIEDGKEWLHRLAGRRVRIVPDADDQGLEACAKWTASLRGVGATVDAERPPDGLKDLGPVAAHPAAFTSYLNQLFAI
jgi:hypothetical protein